MLVHAKHLTRAHDDDQGEVAMAAVCLELACFSTNEHRDIARETFVKSSCANAKTYESVYKMLQQTLGLNRKVDLQHLVVRYGCASLRPLVIQVLQLYKERFLAQLGSTEERSKADFTRPTFLAAAFALVMKKNKMKVDQKELLEIMSVAQKDFMGVQASMLDLCPGEVGITKRKRGRSKAKGNEDSDEEEEEDQKEEEERPTRHQMGDGKGEQGTSRKKRRPLPANSDS
jgi:hypothetical protein